MHQVKHTSNEQSITGEDNTLVTILHIVADTVLRVTRSVQGLDGDTLSNLELLAMCWSLGDGLALLSADDGELAELFQLGAVSIESN